MKDKQEIRRQIAAKRKTLDAQWLKATSVRVVENLQSLETFKTAKTLALYMASGGEVDLESLLPVCWNLGKRTCIPVFNTKTQLYGMAELSADTPCRTGHYGIREPIAPTPVSMTEIEWIAVPGMAFDPQGNRLGRGGGHYDRLLKGFRGQAVGVAFDFQLLPRIPIDSNDQPVRCIVSDIKTLNI